VSKRHQEKLDALSRQAPELLAKVQAGEMSCHAACVEAGIVKVPTPEERIEREFLAADSAAPGDLLPGGRPAGLLRRG
jgi:hypothetical protein